MIVIFLLLSLSLFSNNIEMIKMKNGMKFETVDSNKKNGYEPIIFDDGLVTPFVVSKENNEKYFTKLLENISLPLDYQIDYFEFDKGIATKVRIDLTFWKEKFPSDKENLKKFYSKLLNFIRRKSSEEANFHKFLFIHEMIIRYCPLEKDENLDSILYNYMEDDSVPFGYKDIILKNALTYEPLVVYKPILIKRVVYKYSQIGTYGEIFRERENFIESSKIKTNYSLDTKQEIATFVKTLEDSLNSLNEDEAYIDILIAIKNVVRADLVYNAIKGNKNLNKLELFLSIIFLRDLNRAIEFVNDLSISVFLRRALIMNLIDMQDNYEDAFKVREKIRKELSPNAQLTKSPSLTEFSFQFLPLTKFLLSSKDILNEINKKENINLKMNEILNLSIKKYKELMKLESVNEGNQIFRYISDYYLIRQAVEYSDLAKDKNFELFVFSTMSKSLENKRNYLREISQLEEEIIREAYYSFLGIEMSLEIDNLLFSKIVENRSLAHFLNSYLNLYNEIREVSSILYSSREFQFDCYLKKASVEIILSNKVEDLENAKSIINHILYNYPENISSLYLLLNRAITIKIKNGDKSLIEKVKEIEKIIEKYKK